jgi:hypothetical protein
MADRWTAVLVAGPSAPLLNGCERVQAVMINHAFEQLMPKGKSLMLNSLLSAEKDIDAELLATAYTDFDGPSTVCVQGPHVALRITLDGVPLTTARLASLPSRVRQDISTAWRSSILLALRSVLSELWTGGFIFLRSFAAQLCTPALRDEMDTLAAVLRAARDDGREAAIAAQAQTFVPDVEGSVELPALPSALTCSGCGELISASPACCSRCQLASYHNRECQERHWRGGHKEECRPRATKPLFMRFGTQHGGPPTQEDLDKANAEFQKHFQQST